MQLIKTAHKWLSLIIGIQFAIWVISGLVFSLINSEDVAGVDLRSTPPKTAIDAEQAILDHERILSYYASRQVREILLTQLSGHPVYQVTLNDRTELRDARTGEVVSLSATTAENIAREHYAGPADTAASTTLLHQPNLETRSHKGALWKIDFKDASGTSVYISAENGQLAELRTDAWRLADFFWMLHIMDYSGRENPNNALVIFVAFGSLWLALSGVTLLVKSFSPSDFNLVARFRKAHVPVAIHNNAGALLHKLEIRAGTNLYQGLTRQAVDIPSNCGGGGSCGLCQLRLYTPPPANAAEKALIAPQRIREGFRLACQQRVEQPIKLELEGQALSASQMQAEVVATHFVTPFIKEIRLRPLIDLPFEFTAGSFIQVKTPSSSLKFDSCNVPPELAEISPHWPEIRPLRHDESIRRSYSLANYPESGSGDLWLNVRIQPPPPGTTDIPPGRGSTYMFNLRPGDVVNLSGPYGSFHAKTSGREMILIGGGAGMAPLRSIILDQLLNLQSDRRIGFWYGARSKRDIFYRQQFDQLALRYENFNWQLALSEPLPEDDWQGETGFIHQVLFDIYLRDHPDIQNCEFYICGPPLMLAATLKMLEQAGVSDSNIAFDDFGS